MTPTVWWLIATGAAIAAYLAYRYERFGLYGERERARWRLRQRLIVALLIAVAVWCAVIGWSVR
jgi:hypothetical protein